MAENSKIEWTDHIVNLWWGCSKVHAGCKNCYGESGHKKRPFNIDWAYRMKRICEEQNTPFFFKQIDKIQSIPNDLMIKEYPNFIYPE